MLYQESASPFHEAVAEEESLYPIILILNYSKHIINISVYVTRGMIHSLAYCRLGVVAKDFSIRSFQPSHT